MGFLFFILGANFKTTSDNPMKTIHMQHSVSLKQYFMLTRTYTHTHPHKCTNSLSDKHVFCHILLNSQKQKFFNSFKEQSILYLGRKYFFNEVNYLQSVSKSVSWDQNNVSAGWCPFSPSIRRCKISRKADMGFNVTCGSF